MASEEDLRRIGCNLSPSEFKDRCNDLFVACYPTSTVEELLCSWPDAGSWCALVRQRLNIPFGRDADFLILWEILGSRKLGKLSLKERRRKPPAKPKQ